MGKLLSNYLTYCSLVLILIHSSCQPVVNNWKDLNKDSLYHKADLGLETKFLFSDTNVFYLNILDSFNFWKVTRPSNVYYSQDYVLENSTDGGKTWRKILDYKAAASIFFPLKDKKTFILIRDSSLVVGNNYDSISYLITLPGKISSIDRSTFYDSARNSLYLIDLNNDLFSDNSYIFNIEEKTLKKFKPPRSYPLFNLYNDTLLVTGGRYLYKSIDGGVSWNKDSLKENDFKALNLDLRFTDLLRLSDNTNAKGKSIYITDVYLSADENDDRSYFNLYSNDFGNTWTQLDSNINYYFLPTDAIITRQNINDSSNNFYWTTEKLGKWNKFSGLYVFHKGNRYNKYLILTTDKKHIPSVISIGDRASYLTDERKHSIKSDSFYLGKVVGADYFTKADKYKIIETSDSIKLVLLIKKGLAFNGEIKCILNGADTFQYKINKRVLTDKYYIGENENEIVCSFHKKLINAKSGITIYQLELTYIDSGKEHNYLFGTFRYMHSTWFQKNPVLTWTIKIIFLYSILISLLYLFWPYGIYWLYKKISTIKKIQSLFPSAKLHDTTFDILLIGFVKRKRVLDAWIAKHKKDFLDNFFNENTTKEHSGYVQLPIEIKDFGKIEKPNPKELSFLLNGRGFVIQIIGTGGIGKTTLMIKLAKWALSPNSEQWFRHIYIPILIEEETTDILKTIKAKIITWTSDETINDLFLSALLKRKRFLILIDAISERSSEMQQYVQNVHGELPINAILITSRTELNFHILDQQFLYPQFLVEDSLMAFVKSLLDKTPTPLFENMADRFKLAIAITNIFKLRDQNVPITPILTKIVVEYAIEICLKKAVTDDINFVISRLPQSMPDAYFKYLKSVYEKNINPPLSEIGEMRSAAEIIAYLSLEGNFVPRDVSVESLNEHFKKHQVLKEKIDLIDKLISSGIITPPKDYGNRSFVRFILDPLAENLAAMYFARQCGNYIEKWDNLYQNIDEKEAKTFRQTLLTIQIVYAKELGWCEAKN